MYKNEFKQIFFQLLEDEEFKTKLQDFILLTVQEKFSKAAESVEESPAIPENVDDERISALESKNAELLNSLNDLQAECSVMDEGKTFYKAESRELSKKLEKAVADKISAESKFAELQRQLENLRHEKSKVETDRNNISKKIIKKSNMRIG